MARAGFLQAGLAQWFLSAKKHRMTWGNTEMKTISRLVALAFAAAAPLTLVGTAQATDTGSISGHVWHDLDNDLIRDADEPGIANHYLVIEGTGHVVKTDARGEYVFEHLAPGSYQVRSTDRSGWGQGWIVGGNTSAFRPDNGALWMPITLQAGQQVKNVDSGFATARVDTAVWQLTISNPTPKVGDVIDIYGSTYLKANVYAQFGGQLTLPDGLRVVERLGGMPKFYETEPKRKVTGFFHDRRSAPEWVGARVVVEEPLVNAEIKYDVFFKSFGATDPDLTNDATSRTLSTTS